MLKKFNLPKEQAKKRDMLKIPFGGIDILDRTQNQRSIKEELDFR